MQTQVHMQSIIDAALLRAHETDNEVALWKRFFECSSLTTQDAIEYILCPAENPIEVAEALGFDDGTFESEKLPRLADNWDEVRDHFGLEVVGGLIYRQDDVVFSESYNRFLLADDAVEVRVARRNGRWVTDWMLSDDSDVFACSQTNEYYGPHCTAVRVDGETVCLEACENGLYYWENVGEYHWEPEPENEGLEGYHDGKRSPVLPGEAVSLELEVDVHGDKAEFAEEIRSVADAAEEDGSLGDNGAEIIFGSTSLEEIGEKVREVCEVLARYNCKGHDAGTGYGLHVSVSRKGWGITESTLAKIILFVHTNQTFFEALAQRQEVHWSKYARKSVKACMNALCEKEKYEAVAVRSSDRVEFRLFRSNVKAARILKAVEAVAAVIRFCKANSVQQCTLENFRKSINKKDYPNLVNFIAEKSI